jgi:hypothetical protein
VRLFGLDISRRRELETVSPPEGEAGADGESWYADMQEGGPDVNPELSGSAKWPVYDEMRKSDAAIKSTLWMMKLPIRSGFWNGEEASADPVDLLARDLVAWNLGLGDEMGELDLSWDESLQQGLQMFDWGPMFEELVWGDLTLWRDADGNEHAVRPLARLAPRLPSSIRKVNMVRGRIESVEQNIPGTRPIPGSKISYLVTEREPGRWDGASMMRPMWGAWRMKKALMIAAGIAWDRHGGGGHVEVRYPPGKKAEAEDIGRNVRAHERGYTAFEDEGGPPESQRWQLKFHGVTLNDPIPLLRFYSGEIGEAGLQQFSKLAVSEHGSRAVGEVLVDPFFLAVQAFAGYIARERARQVARRIVDVNLGTEVATPRITVSKVKARSLETITRAIADLAAAGFNFADRETQDDVRDLLELPHLPEANEALGLTRERFEALLARAGLTPEAIAVVVRELPPEVGIVAGNGGVPREGDGLGLP